MSTAISAYTSVICSLKIDQSIAICYRVLCLADIEVFRAVFHRRFHHRDHAEGELSTISENKQTNQQQQHIIALHYNSK